MQTFVDNLIVSMYSGFWGQFVYGAFVLIAAWYVFSTENKKTLIIKKHEIAINELIPNVYTPLLSMLDEHLEKVRLGRKTSFDYIKVLEVLEKNPCLLFFIPDDIQPTLTEIKKICYSYNTPNVDYMVSEGLLIGELSKLKQQIMQKFAQYIL